MRKMSEQFDLSESPFRVDFGAEWFGYLLDSHALLCQDVCTSTAAKSMVSVGDSSSPGWQEYLTTQPHAFLFPATVDPSIWEN